MKHPLEHTLLPCTYITVQLSRLNVIATCSSSM